MIGEVVGRLDVKAEKEEGKQKGARLASVGGGGEGLR